MYEYIHILLYTLFVSFASSTTNTSFAHVNNTTSFFTRLTIPGNKKEEEEKGHITTTMNVPKCQRSFTMLFAALLLSFLTSQCSAQITMATTTLSQSLTTTTIICPSNGTSSSSTRLKSQDPVRSFAEISGAVFSNTHVSPSSSSSSSSTSNTLLYAVTDGLNNNYNRSKVSGGRIGVFDSGTGKRLFSWPYPIRPNLITIGKP